MHDKTNAATLSFIYAPLSETSKKIDFSTVSTLRST